MSDEVFQARAAAVIDGNKYLTLATVDEAGAPWATPVYFTPDGHSHFYWASAPAAQHSRNIARSPEVGIVIFDSSVAIGRAEAVYLTAHAHEVPEGELVRCAELYAARYPELREYSPDELRAPADLRLYRATATRHWLLVRGGDPDYGTGIDARVPVWTSG